MGIGLVDLWKIIDKKHLLLISLRFIAFVISLWFFFHNDFYKSMYFIILAILVQLDLLRLYTVKPDSH